MFKKRGISQKYYPNLFDNALQFSSNIEHCSLLHSNNLTLDKHFRYNYLIALEHISLIDSKNLNYKSYLDNISEFTNSNNGNWIFASLSYDIKNSIEKLSSNNLEKTNFNDFELFIPKYVFSSTKDELIFYWHESISKKEADDFLENLNDSKINTSYDNTYNFNKFEHRITKQQYLDKIESAKTSIEHGDIYEINFCQEFYVENANIDDPWQIFKKLQSISPAPFSAYYKSAKMHLISASPERYMQKDDCKIISQPIKGTAGRMLDKQLDLEAKEELQKSIKERAENIMIVDLVRNDLSKIPSANNTIVEELCLIYSFRHVHQMISTVSTEIDKNTCFSDILKATFPMGSMTGAPKLKSMEIIEKLEDTKRGLFSGSIGYIEPNRDFDFNVIIRSLIYNSESNYLSLSTGGAITYLCNAEDEYKESLLKAEAVFKLFD